MVKKNKRFKTGLIAVSILLMFTIVLSACQQKAGLHTSEDNDEKNESIYNPAGTFPIVREKAQLSILVCEDYRITDWTINDQTKFVEELTGVDIKWEYLPSGEGANQKLKLLISSGELPEILFFGGYALDKSEMSILTNEGIILPIDQYIDEHGAFLKKLLAYRPDAYDSITYPDGRIYSIPKISECYHCQVHQRMSIYKPWLDSLGLDIPKTTDELYNVLKAFKEKDPNGNSKNDEIPMAGYNSKIGLPQSFLMNSFIYYSAYDEYYVDGNGKIVIPYIQEEWRNGLRYINKLFSEGLIAAETFTQDNNQLKSMILSEPVTIGSVIHRYANLGVMDWDGGEESHLYKEYVNLLPLAGPDGYRVTPWRYFVNTTEGMAITNNCKDPVLAFKFGDALLSEEISLVSLWGIEGKGYKKADPGLIGINGRPALYEQLLIGSAENLNMQWFYQGPYLMTADMRLGASSEKGDEDFEVWLYNITKEVEPYKVDIKNLYPPLFFTDDESISLTDMNMMLKYIDESTARFITGDLDIESDWDSYINEIKKQGIDEYIKIYQNAYERMKK
jgi:putative aldouronate transport system substrate-binding protein